MWLSLKQDPFFWCYVHFLSKNLAHAHSTTRTDGHVLVVCPSWSLVLLPMGVKDEGYFLVSRCPVSPTHQPHSASQGKWSAHEKPLRAGSHCGPGRMTTLYNSPTPRRKSTRYKKTPGVPVFMQPNPCTWAQAIIIPAISNQGALRKVMFTLGYNWSLALQELSTARESTWVGPFQTLAVASTEERNG